MRASEFIVEDKIQKGINIRVDGDIDYAGLIADGKKRYETRNTNSLKPYIGKTVAIVRTGKGPATAIGEVTIGKPIVADETTFEKLRKHHLVPSGSKFDITQGGIKYLYPMLNPIRWEEEKPVKHHGIVARQVQWESLNEYDEQSTGKLITYKQHKGKNKFSVEMSVNGKSAGVFQYDANSGRTITELDPEFRGQGLGQLLILKGIYTAAMLGMNYVEDESRTEMFDRAMDSLANAGYIVNDDEYWYVTDQGERFLKQDIAEGFFDRFFKPKMKFNFSEAGEELYCDVTLGKETVGNFTFDRIGKDLEAQDMNVVAKFRGQGIAKRVYDTLKAKGFTIHRSPHQTEDGKRFWDKNRGVGSKVWEDASDSSHTVLWHGTSESVSTIKKVGLRAGRQHSVFLTDNPDLALEYGVSDQERTGYDTVTLVTVDLSKLDKTKLIGDIDHTTEEDWVESLRATDQCMYMGNILPSMIIKLEDFSD